METKRSSSSRLRSYATMGACLCLSWVACQPQQVVVDSNFDPSGKWNAGTKPVILNGAEDPSKTNLLFRAGYGEIILNARIETSHKEVALQFPGFSSTFRASFDKSTSNIKFDGLLGFLSPDPFLIHAKGDGTTVLEANSVETQAGYACDIALKKELFVQFHDSDTLDFHLTTTQTIINTSNEPTKNCVQYFKDGLATGAKPDAGIQSLVSAGILDPNKFDKLLTITSTEEYQATRESSATQ